MSESLEATMTAGKLEALIGQAKGSMFYAVRDTRTGRVLRVADSAASDLGKYEELLEVWERDPDAEAFAELMDLALGEVPEQPRTIRLRMPGRRVVAP